MLHQRQVIPHSNGFRASINPQPPSPSPPSSTISSSAAVSVANVLFRRMFFTPHVHCFLATWLPLYYIVVFIQENNIFFLVFLVMVNCLKETSYIIIKLYSEGWKVPSLQVRNTRKYFCTVEKNICVVAGSFGYIFPAGSPGG